MVLIGANLLSVALVAAVFHQGFNPNFQEIGLIQSTLLHLNLQFTLSYLN